MARNLTDLVAEKKNEFQARQQAYKERYLREQELENFKDAVEVRLSSTYIEYVDAVDDALFYNASDSECADALVVSITNDIEEIAKSYDLPETFKLDANYIYSRCIRSFKMYTTDNKTLAFKHIFNIAFADQAKTDFGM